MMLCIIGMFEVAMLAAWLLQYRSWYILWYVYMQVIKDHAYILQKFYDDTDVTLHDHGPSLYYLCCYHNIIICCHGNKETS